ncbi:hypothetical protein ACTM5Z_004378 [Salmonella enterica]
MRKREKSLPGRAFRVSATRTACLKNVAIDIGYMHRETLNECDVLNALIDCLSREDINMTLLTRQIFANAGKGIGGRRPRGSLGDQTA